MPGTFDQIKKEHPSWSNTKIKKHIRAHGGVVSFAKETESDWQEVFKTGDYPQGSFTEADIVALAKNYNPDDNAPLFIGAGQHPDKQEQDNTNPVGFVAALKASGKVLLAKFKDVAEGAKLLIKDAIVKGPSVSFNKKTHKLIHILLCTGDPQVTDIEPLSFARQDDVVTVNFNSQLCKGETNMAEEFKEPTMQECMSAIKALSDKVDKLLAEEEKEANSETAEAAKAPDTEKKPEKKTPEETGADEKEGANMAKVISLEKKVQYMEREARRKDIASFVHNAINGGKLPPSINKIGGTDGLVDFMASLPADEVVSFGKAKMTREQFIRAMIVDLDKNVCFSSQTKTDADREADAAVETEIDMVSGQRRDGTGDEANFNKTLDQVRKDNPNISDKDAYIKAASKTPPPTYRAESGNRRGV